MPINNEWKWSQRQALQNNEEAAFLERVSAQKRVLYGIAYSYLRNEADALEALQEATCRAWQHRKRLKDQERFDPWVIRILINCCHDELKRRKRTAVAALPADDTVMEMQSGRNLDLEQALDQVKLKYRQVLVLKYYRDMTLTEIAKVLDKPEGTIKTWLHKGLGQLRGKMKDERGGAER
ncbi:sigma-70 family RNA polymerase sigma factor [Paenibacillus sp. NFR01]|uniref:sigma-70 family RNA polymerase sigma factor n=1 Tax=Paenibacillus sp. NFR01 TaxID=1566279 RepID=UPI0008D329B0|nr:sigma-70 family RNA polymerase sigma factor [Paenibacillus sp. NFR01]SET48128.1 RNA polymerase sigma-70 factor, ECF subfamily [Paenibacillus sp. NFR01]